VSFGGRWHGGAGAGAGGAFWAVPLVWVEQPPSKWRGQLEAILAGWCFPIPNHRPCPDPN